jgi:two-component system, chemotaxis family, response regulator Rcp1
MNILIVDQNLIDAYVTKEALKDAFTQASIHLIHTGTEAITLLYREGPYRSLPRQDLILLDLQLRKPTGLDFLSCLKSSPVLQNFPVVVLTNPDLDTDPYTTYALGAHYYLQKPHEPEAYRMVGYVIRELWERGLLQVGMRPPWDVPEVGI